MKSDSVMYIFSCAENPWDMLGKQYLTSFQCIDMKIRKQKQDKFQMASSSSQTKAIKRNSLKGHGKTPQ